MAEQTNNKEVTGGSKFPVKTVLILGAVLTIEAVAISGAFLFAGGPAKVRADSEAAAQAAAVANQPVEVKVLEDNFQNTRSGRAYLYDTEIYIVVPKKYEDQVNGALKNDANQIVTDVATIFRRAEPEELLEPSLATLARQIKVCLDGYLGNDEQGKPIIDRVLVVKCHQMRAD